MITIYTLPHSRATRIIWLMEELGLPYTVEKYEREADGSSTPAFKQIHPLGKAPTIKDGEVVLFESGAILEYIIHKYGNEKFFIAYNSPDYPLYIQWMYAIEGTVMPQIIQQYSMARSGVDQSSLEFKKAIESRDTILSYIDTELGTRPYLGGQEFSAADMMMANLFQIFPLLKIDIATYKNLQKYADTVQARPAYKKAQEQQD